MNYIASDGSKWAIENIGPMSIRWNMDWEWVSTEYDGPGDDRHGNAGTKALAIEAVEDWIEDSDR